MCGCNSEAIEILHLVDGRSDRHRRRQATVPVGELRKNFEVDAVFGQEVLAGDA